MDEMNDVVYVTYEGTTPFVEDNVITIYGTEKGSTHMNHKEDITLSYHKIEAEIIE